MMPAMDGASVMTEHCEAERLQKLQSFAILDTPQEHEFDTVVLLCQRLLGVPIALNRPGFAGGHGL